MALQPDTKRMVTEASFKTLLDADYSSRKRKSRLLGDQMKGYKGTVSPEKCVVSLVAGGYDGFPATYTAYTVEQMMAVAECNWTADTLLNSGGYMYNFNKSNGIGNVFEYTTMVEGDYFWSTFYKGAGVSQQIRIWVDDEEVTTWYDGLRQSGTLKTRTGVLSYAVDYTLGIINLRFASWGVYKVRVSGMITLPAAAPFGVGTIGTLQKPAKQRVFGVISDSWYDTIPANTSLNPSIEIGAQMGWRAWNLAVGGSGFVNPSAYGSGPHNYGSDAVFAKLALAPPMDLLLLNGSCNDLGYSEATVRAAMQAFFTRWRTVRPDTPIVWIGLEPQSYFENIYTSPTMVARENALATEALADPSVIGVIRPCLENWLTGTGNTVTPNNTGNQDIDTGPDGVHLSPAGTIQIGKLVTERLKSIPTWKVAA